MQKFAQRSLEFCENFNKLLRADAATMSELLRTRNIEESRASLVKKLMDELRQTDSFKVHVLFLVESMRKSERKRFLRKYFSIFQRINYARRRRAYEKKHGNFYEKPRSLEVYAEKSYKKGAP